ncbi:MAG: DUF3087 family protein [Pontibacterium sp.]
MNLQTIDKSVFRVKQRNAFFAFAVCLAILGLAISALFRLWFGNAEGSNTLINLAGVLTGAAISGVIFSKLRKHSWFDELNYGLQLKRVVLRIQNKKHIWKEKALAGDQQAATVMAYYYAGIDQLQFLENNEVGQQDMSNENKAFQAECTAAGHSYEFDHTAFDEAWLK